MEYITPIFIFILFFCLKTEFIFILLIYFLEMSFYLLETQQEVDRYGIQKCIEMALDHIDPKNDRDYHISFDIDALDRSEAPSTGYPRK